MKKIKYVAMFFCACILTGCKTDLYSNLSELDANQMLALLNSNGVDAAKKEDKGKALKIIVEEDDFGRAVEILRQHGLPKKSYKSVEDLFPTGQLVTSPSQEMAKLIFIKEQELSKLLNDIEGVINSDVVISYNIDKSYAGEVESDDLAVSVLVKYSPETDLKNFSSQIRDLVYNALLGVKRDKISLVMQPVNYRSSEISSLSVVDATTHAANDAKRISAFNFLSDHKNFLAGLFSIWVAFIIAVYLLFKFKLKPRTR